VVNHPIMFVFLAIMYLFYFAFYVIKIIIFIVLVICKWIAKKFKKRTVGSNVNR